MLFQIPYFLILLIEDNKDYKILCKTLTAQAKIIKRSKTSQLLQIRQTCQRLFDLVEDSENFKAYLDEEDKVLHSLGEYGCDSADLILVNCCQA